MAILWHQITQAQNLDAMKKRVLMVLAATFPMLFLLTSCANPAGEPPPPQTSTQAEAAAPLPPKDSTANAQTPKTRDEKDDDEKEE